MLYGIVDIGSNSIRLSVYQYQEGLISLLINKKVMAGLAGYVSGGALTDAGIKNACEVLGDFKEILYRFGVEESAYFATASLRNISNREEVLTTIFHATGVLPEIISGDEEAQLDFVGATHFLPLEKGILVDIGGGSTELVLFENGAIHNLISLPIGSLSLHARFVEGLLPRRQERKEIRKAIRKELDKLDWAFTPGTCICGVGGTVRAFFKVARQLFHIPSSGPQLDTAYIGQVSGILSDKEHPLYQTAYQIMPERVFSLLPGIMILEEIACKFDCATILQSLHGVREGYLIERVIKAQNEKKE